jgi:polar amino acid transport system substrate-binding protein
MRKLAAILAVASLTIGIAACGGDDDDSTKNATTDTTAKSSSGLPDLGGKTVTVAVENAYLPFNYINPDTGKGAGWDYDAWNAICVKLNCKVSFKEAAWEGMIQAVSDGQYDAAADGITINDERKKVVDFSDGYTKVDQRLLVRKDENRFSSADDIKNDTSLKIGTQTGTTNFDKAKELWGESRIQAFEQFPFAVQALINGDVDVVIMDETAGQGYVGANADKLKLVGDPLQSDELGFIFPKGSHLVGQVNEALAALKDDGTLDRLAEAYFSDKFTPTREKVEAAG